MASVDKAAVMRQIDAACAVYGPRVGIANTRALAIALTANGIAESGLNVNAVGAAGEIGIWQFKTTGKALGTEALNQGITRDQLRTVDVGCAVMCWACGRSSDVRRAAEFGTVGDLTRAICIYVERPANSIGKAEERVQILRNQGVDPSTRCSTLG